MTTCGIYARVSTDGQTIGSQIEVLTEYAKGKKWDIYDTYQDDALSGAYLEIREDFLRLLTDAKWSEPL
jgi:DNA invertase Pin-like site-specific DNA recombinase